MIARRQMENGPPAIALVKATLPSQWMVSIIILVALALFTFGREWLFIYQGIPFINGRNNQTMTKHENDTQQQLQKQKSRPFHLIQEPSSTRRKNSTNRLPSSSAKVENSTSQIESIMPVFLLPISPGTECQNTIYEEGMWNSSAISVVTNINSSVRYPSFVWLHQAMSNRRGPVCYPELLDQSREFYQQDAHTPLLSVSSSNSTRNSTLPGASIHVFDWFDQPDTLPRCQNMEDLVGFTNVHYWKRSIVHGRRWNNVTRTVDLGKVVSQVDGVPVQFLPYAVRTDMVHAIHRFVQQTVPSATKLLGDSKESSNPHWNASALTEYLVTKGRPGDVVHYWPVNGSNDGISRGGRGHENSILRTVTSETLLELSYPPHNVPNILCNVQGTAGRRGRASVTNDYVQSMLHYKIIVVVQRDEWEGHFRLFEAMISGAMVIHDRMLALPWGIQENVNIVLFENMEDLKQKVMHYLKYHQERLEIARRGRQLAMCHHRSWHRIEQVVFGRTVTRCDE